jgi:hypothetical protein
VELGRPKISGIVQTWRRLEDELRLGLVPVGQPVTAVKSNVHIIRVGHVVVVLMAEDPSVIFSIDVEDIGRGAYGSAPTVLRIGLVKVVDELGGAEYWQRATAARAAVSRNLNISSVEQYCNWRS